MSYRIETDHYPDGKPYIRVELPPMSDPQLYILESVVSAIWNVVDPKAGPTLAWLPRQRSDGAEPLQKSKSPRVAALGQGPVS